MPKKVVDKNKNIKEKLKFLGLNLEDIPKELKKRENLEFRIPREYKQNQYRQYRYVPVKDIQILLSPTNRLDDIEEKYKKARPLADYLDSKREENILRYTTFLNMLNQLKIEDVEKIEEEQENLAKKIPFKVKYENNYLWQIYYSKSVDKYFMIVSTEDTDFSTFFYLLKKQIEQKKGAKIFVPIRNVEYRNNYLKPSEFEDIENCLWLFTKDWPLVYEVFDRNNKISIQIVGEAEVYQKIKSNYKIKIESQEEAIKLYKLLKALFILQTELPNYFSFKTSISRNAGLEFYLDAQKIDYEDIAEWINEQYDFGTQKQEVASRLIQENRIKLEDLKAKVSAQEIEYLAKEKQISTFLECKKTFFGKFKYFFKYGKKNKDKKVINQKPKETEIEEKQSETIKRRTKKNYTVEELLEEYKIIELKENELKNLIMDINSLKLKYKNMQKKIENATAFIEEIDSHKRSIFEFWKYSNKDEMDALPEGETEEVNIIKKIVKTFDYEADMENFGKTMDKIQRKVLEKSELDSIYIANTNVIDILNKIKTNDFSPKDIEVSLKELKRELAKISELKDEEFDIFGGSLQTSSKVSTINNKNHREIPKDKYNILEISKNTKQLGFKLVLEKVINNIKTAIGKVTITEEIPIYKAVVDDKLDARKINVFDINPENEMKETLENQKGKVYFYKINLPIGANAVSYTNSVFYDNKNKTLPVGQDLSSKVLIDINRLTLKLKCKTNFKMIEFEDDKSDFSKAIIKNVSVFEYDAKPKKTEEI